MAGVVGVHNLLVKAAPASADIFRTGIHMSRLIKEGQSMEMAQVIRLCTIQVRVRVRYREGYWEFELKGQCHEIFCFWFFHESLSPQPQSIPLGPFRIFLKICGDIQQVKVQHQYQRHRWQICRWCQRHQRKEAAGIYVTNGKFDNDTGGAPWAANISADFRKNSKQPFIVYSGAWGKLSHEKNQKSKISLHCPFKWSVHIFRQIL